MVDGHCGEAKNDPIIASGGSMGRSYRELIAWQKSMKFVTEV